MPMGLATLGQAKAPGNGEPARDLGKAKAAFDMRDSEASKAVHAVIVPKNKETHPKMGEYMKSFVFGGLDGIITTFAVVAGAAGGGFGPDIVIVMGVSSLIADALSMGVGDALSSKAEAEVAKREREREKWELENFKEGEVMEMVEIYKGKGMAEEDAELVMRVCAKYDDLFVDMMLVDELGISPPDDDDSWMPYVKEGCVTFCSFCVFGFVPIAAYCIVGTASQDVDSRALFIISSVFTAAMLFVLGGALRPRAASSP
jgi:DNA damage-binding protein 1